MTLDVLEPGSIYHIYNHAVGKENLFLSPDNYSYFLKRYQFFINPVADTYVYCLMLNHLHFLVEVKDNISVPSDNKIEGGILMNLKKHIEILKPGFPRII